MAATACVLTSGPMSVPAASGSPIGTLLYAFARRSQSASTTFSWTSRRRVVVQRWPAVPTEPNSTARATSSMSASSITMIALLPPSSSRQRPRRLATTSPTRRPMRHEPVAEMSGRRRSAIIVSPTSASVPMMSGKMSAGSMPSGLQTSCSRSTFQQISLVAIAVSGVMSDGFQMHASPQTAATIAFHAHTAFGKLNAVMQPITPSGCHCSYMRWPGRSECIERP